MVSMLAAASLFAAVAAAAAPQSVTIGAEEFFPASGTATITIEASGGVFGAGIPGTGETTQYTIGGATSQSHRRAAQYHGVDVYTTSDGAITFSWQFTCMYTTDVHSVCSGPWHITGGSGAYDGARGGGTAVDQCDDEYNGAQGAYSGTRCSDTLLGKIQAP